MNNLKELISFIQKRNAKKKKEIENNPNSIRYRLNDINRLRTFWFW